MATDTVDVANIARLETLDGQERRRANRDDLIEGRLRYVVAWPDLLQLMVPHIRALVEAGEEPPRSYVHNLAAVRADGADPDVRDNPLRTVLWERARALGPSDWDVALTPLGEGEVRTKERAEAMEVCRLWYTELLHREVGDALGLRLVGGKEWRQ